MPRAKPPRKPHGLERWQGQEASQQYAVRVLTLTRKEWEVLQRTHPEELERVHADEALARTLPEELQPTLCGFAGLTPGSERATVMLAKVARVLALWPGLPEALAPGAATVAVALGRVEGLAHKFREALGNLDPRSRAFLERQHAGSAPKLDLVQARKFLLTLEGRAHDAIRELRGKGRGRPAHREQKLIAVQLGKVFDKIPAVPGHRASGMKLLGITGKSVSMTRAENRLGFVGAALQATGIRYPDKELRRTLATRRSAQSAV